MRILFRLLLLCLASLWLAACQPAQPKLDVKGTDITGVSFGGDFSLTDQQGARRSLSEFKGKAVALFFGYTHCPDVCPTTMAEYASAMKQLGADAAKVQVLFITVDPARDTVKVLSSYVPFFDKRFIGLTGTPDEVGKVTSQFKVVAERKPAAGGDYSIDHTAGSYLIDPQGQLRVYEPNGTPAAALAHDLVALVH
jgi:protein SCO1/2